MVVLQKALTFLHSQKAFKDNYSGIMQIHHISTY